MQTKKNPQIPTESGICKPYEINEVLISNMHLSRVNRNLLLISYLI